PRPSPASRRFAIRPSTGPVRPLSLELCRAPHAVRPRQEPVGRLRPLPREHSDHPAVSPADHIQLATGRPAPVGPRCGLPPTWYWFLPSFFPFRSWIRVLLP